MIARPFAHERNHSRPEARRVSAKQMTIRPAAPSDAADITRLAAQLGYPADAAAIAGRLTRIAGRADQLAIVAVWEGKIVGWLQAGASEVLESGFRVEILGLIVDESRRRRGIGRCLVQQAEKWAAGIGAEAVVVRSNTKRVASHSFYPALGYGVAKTQTVYRKLLNPVPERPPVERTLSGGVARS